MYCYEALIGGDKMPIHHSIWKIGENIEEVNETNLSSEEKLEDIFQILIYD